MTKRALDRIAEGLAQAAAIARGEAVPGAVVHEPPDVRALRARLGLTQPAFAARFGLPVGTVRDWKQGRAAPDQAARVLLRVIARAPDAVAQAVAAE